MKTREVIRLLILLFILVLLVLINKRMTEKAIAKCIDEGNSSYFCYNKLR